MNQENESKALIKDLKSQMRQEKIIGYLKTHKKLISYFLSAIILLAITWASISFYSKIQSKKYSAILHQAMIDERNGEMEKSLAALEKIYKSSAPSGVKEIASLKYAAQLLEQNQSEQAVATYLTINKNKKFDAYIREYSGLIALKILVGENKPENREQIIALEVALEKTSKILNYYILEQKGIFEWNSGDFKASNQTFQTLAENPEAPDMLKKRAIEMVGIYNSKFGAEEIKKVEEKTEEPKSSEESAANPGSSEEKKAEPKSELKK